MKQTNRSLQQNLKKLHEALNVVDGTNDALRIMNTKMPFASRKGISNPSENIQRERSL